MTEPGTIMKPLTRQSTESTSTYPIKVLQFGEGNFLRAFADWIIDILNEKAGFNGSVQIIQPIRKGMASMINAQDGLYHVVLNGIKNGIAAKEIRLITCVSGAVNPYEDLHTFLKAGENPDLKIVISNTTEAGISFDGSDTSPDSLPNSFPGKVTMLLYHRYRHFQGAPDKALTFLPCELIDKNGDALRTTVLQYAIHWKLPADFEHWIREHNIFCNTLVDRIVPGFPKDTVHEIRQETGYADNMVVLAELFHLWVIEGPEQVRHLLPASKAGLEVKFVEDMAPYRTRKVRILNGAHTVMVPVAYLYGLRTVRESVENEELGKYIRKVIFEEIIPTLDLPPDELKQFADDVIERFLNPFIRHELSSIALNSVSKFKVRVLPSILEYIKRKKQLPERLLFSLAALICFYKGTWQNIILPVSDSPEIVAFFKTAWKNDAAGVADAVLSNAAFWGEDLGKVKGLKESVTKHLKYIQDCEKIGTPFFSF